MKQRNNGIDVRVDGYTRWCLTAIAVLLAVLVVALWAERGAWTPQAVAEPGKRGVFVDSAKQRDDLVKAMDRNTEKLQEIINLLKSGQVKVKGTEGAKEAQGAAHVPQK